MSTTRSSIMYDTIAVKKPPANTANSKAKGPFNQLNSPPWEDEEEPYEVTWKSTHHRNLGDQRILWLLFEEYIDNLIWYMFPFITLSVSLFFAILSHQRALEAQI
jgi:hypothetical protein